MAITDRRSGEERRKSERFRVSCEVEWENHAGIRTGTMSDISSDGCFVLTSGDFANGEKVFIYIPIGDGTSMRLAGEINNHVFEIGFAMRFVEMTDHQRQFLDDFVKRNREVQK